MTVTKYKNDILLLIDDLEQGKIKPDILLDDEYGKTSILHLALTIEKPHRSKLSILKSLIDLGCSVDIFDSSHTTPLSMLVSNAFNESAVNLFKNLLKHHHKGHRSDLNILKGAADNLMNERLFDIIIKSDKIDTNVTQMRGSHILHYLATIPDGFKLIDKIFEMNSDTKLNPIHRKGFSPLTMAINEGFKKNAIKLKEYGGKIEGTVNEDNVELIVDLDLVDAYPGDFFNDYPLLIPYAISKNNTESIPTDIKNVFLF